MKVEEIAQLLKAEVHYLPEGFDTDITSAGASDLMSDVLAYVAHDILLITGLQSPQVIRVAHLMDITAVLFSRGKVPDKEILDEAREVGIAVLSTEYTTFTSCGILHRAGIRGLLEGEDHGAEDDLD